MNQKQLSPEKVFNQPWLIREEVLVSMAERGVDVREGVAQSNPFCIDPALTYAPFPLSAAASPAKSASPRLIAVLPVYGPIDQRDDYYGYGTAIDALARSFRIALANPDVKAIVFDFDSPGGSVYGVDEFAAEIFAAREQKKIIAQVNPLAASAAYYLASQAAEIVASPSSETGSIGVVMVHADISKRLEMNGVKPTIIRAGKYKVEANPFEPLSEDAAAHLQSRVDDYYSMFVKAVARGRGVSASDVRSGFGEGRVLGAAEAKRIGLVDRIATFSETLARLGAGASAAVVSAQAETQTSQVSAEAAVRATAQHSPAQAEVIPASAEQHSEVLVDPETQNPGAAGADVNARNQEVGAIINLASRHNMTNKAAAWIASGKSLADVRTEILDGLNPAAIAQPSQERVDGVNPAGSGARAGLPNAAKKPFVSLGEQLVSVVQASRSPHTSAWDPRLLAAATGHGEGVPADGGFLVQQDFSDVLLNRSYETGQIARDVFRIPLSGNANGIKLPAIDETSRVTGSRWGGLQIYWAAESDTVTAKKVKIRRIDLELKKLMALSYVTDEMQQDASAMAAIINKAFPEEFGYVIDDAILNGTGAGQPLGINNSLCRVTVSKESGQAADTIKAENVVKMFARMPARLLGGAKWYVSQDALPQLPLMVIGQQPVFLPPNGLMPNTPFGTLLGRPIVVIEQAETLGDLGDILFANFSEYVMIDKGDIVTASSMHVRFLNDEDCFRWTTRVDGQPAWNNTLTPAKGSNALSPFVVLEAR